MFLSILYFIHSAAQNKFFLKKDNQQTTPVQQWQPSVGEALKKNIGGSFNQLHKSGGWGFIVRDVERDAVGSGAGKLDHLQGPLQADEAEACLHAMIWAREWGMKNIIIETDAQMAAAIARNAHDLAPNGVRFRENKAFGRLNFNSFSMIYCPRACNKAADFLANYGSKMVHETQAVWPGDAHTFIYNLVSSDLARPSG
uniref:Uncharacterized protein n=1 Tax=Avena sativa TaxID=4498 RepID=A0ACD5ZTS0_AVESA